MSRTEALVLLAHMRELVSDLRDLRYPDETPRHVVENIPGHLNALENAVAELARLHGVSK